MVELLILCAQHDAKTSFGSRKRVLYAFFCVGRTQWVVLSAAATQNRMRNACEAPKRRPQQAPTAVGGTPARGAGGILYFSAAAGAP